MPSTFVQWIDRQGWFHATIRKLRLRAVVSQILRIFPFTRRYSSGTRVRVSDLESFFLSDEIFRRETYKNALAGAGAVHTVVDLGCNVGYFGCYLRHYFGRTEFCGIGIDANPALLKLARRNLDLNDLGEIKLLNGLVGASNESSSKPFYVYASHLGSSQFIQPESGRTIKGGWRKIFVPVLKVSEIWIEKYGDVPIDLLKVDIEGSEGKLFALDPDLLRLTKCIVLEWHKWLVGQDEIFPVLSHLGFDYKVALETGRTADLWFFSKVERGRREVRA